MFENYQATKEDFNAIEEALTFVWKPELDFIFMDKSKIENAVVVSYDSQSMYYWVRNNEKYEFHKVKHELNIDDKNYRGWCTNFKIKELKLLLPKALQDSKYSWISGAPFNALISAQKTKPIDNNPYTTYQSYLATIAHEFGHVYYNNCGNTSYFADKKESLSLLKAAKTTFSSEGNASFPNIILPSHKSIGELFAFCTEYQTSLIFWQKHAKNLDTYYTHTLEQAIHEEIDKDLSVQDSYLNDAHNYAAVVGRILIAREKENWPEFILRSLATDIPASE